MSGSIGVTVRAKPPGIVIGSRPSAVKVFFVKLEGGNEAFSATDLIPSNYTHRGQIYLLNAAPGRYVAVAARLKSIDLGELEVTYRCLFFSMAMISETEVTVVPQEMVFMGEYLVSMSRKIKTADASQAHYLQLLSPVAGKFSFARKSEKKVYTTDIKSVAKDTETERGFWTTARDEVFKNDPWWQVQAQRQLDSMEKREPN